MPTRRQFVKGGVVAGTAAALGGPHLLTSRKADAASTIDPNTIPKYQTPLFILPAQVPTGPNQFQVAERRFATQMLPAGFPQTIVNGYGNPNDPSTFHAPGYTIEATVNQQTQVTWMNQLVDSSGNFLPPLFTTDPTIHWANPPGGISGRDSTPTFNSTPPPYTGPQPMIVHLHGTHDFEESDGLPQTWFLPVAKGIPNNFAEVGTNYDAFKEEANNRWGVNWAPGTLTSVYPNTQRAGTLWFHDHVLGMTRLNVHSGLNGFYVLSGGAEDPPDLPGPRPMPGDPPGTKYYDICLSLSDHQFNSDGSLFFPSTSNLDGPYVPTTDVPPYWNNTFQGNVSTVNGNTWPVLTVEPRRYRFRILDADNFRTYNLRITRNATANPATWDVPAWVIAGDAGGVFPTPQPLHTNNIPIFMVTSERVDIVVDFTGIPEGTEFFMVNNTNGIDVNNVGQIMKFVVGPLQSTDTSTPMDQFHGPSRRQLGNPTETHRVSMNVLPNPNNASQQGRFQMGRITQNPDGSFTNTLERWTDPISQTVTLGSTAEWEVWNIPGIGGGHAFHIHLIEFQVTGRETIVLDANGNPKPSGNPGLAIQPWEVGEKDTVFAPPAQITRFIAPFDLASMYIYHCHFIDHEDHEMMRFWQVR
jgi:spore coat protein A, manganese oxidase